MRLQTPLEIDVQGLKLNYKNDKEPFLSVSLDINLSFSSLLQELLKVNHSLADSPAKEAPVPPTSPPPAQPPPPIQTTSPPPGLGPRPDRQVTPDGQQQPVVDIHVQSKWEEIPQAAPGLELMPSSVDASNSRVAGQSPVASPSPGLSLNDDLLDAARRSDVSAAKKILEAKADINFASADSYETPLYVAVSNGGDLEMVDFLIMSRACLNSMSMRRNSISKHRKTPLHCSLQQFVTLDGLVPIMLIVAKADLLLPDTMGMTTIDCAMLLAQELQAEPRLPRSNTSDGPGQGVLASQGFGAGGALRRHKGKLWQLLVEVTEQPTVAVRHVGVEVIKCEFCDASSDNVVFLSKTTLGRFEISNKRIVYSYKLSEVGVKGVGRDLSANPENGMVALCTEIMGRSTSTIFINIWRSGQLKHEQPLVITMKDCTCEDGGRPRVGLTCGRPEQVMHCGLPDGRIIFWTFNSSRSQIADEATEELPLSSTCFEVSPDGNWLAVVDSSSVEPNVQIWTRTGTSSRFTFVNGFLSQAPSTMSVATLQVSGGGCAVALAMNGDATSADSGVAGPTGPLEVVVYVVKTSGQMSLSYKMPTSAMCQSLRFNWDGHLVAVFQDSTIAVYDLLKRDSKRRFYTAELTAFDVSADRSMVVYTERDCIVVQKIA